jgi:hypothetical protein
MINVLGNAFLICESAVFQVQVRSRAQLFSPDELAKTCLSGWSVDTHPPNHNVTKSISLKSPVGTDSSGGD